MKKRCKVVILPTDKAENAILKFGTQLRYVDAYLTQEYIKDIGETSHHLYIVPTDEEVKKNPKLFEIKEGDWCLMFWDGIKEGELGKVMGNPQQYLPENGHTLNRNLRKIIATTDSVLITPYIQPKDERVLSNEEKKGLPQPSKAFIEKYCKVGGIDEIMVEYEEPVNPIKMRGSMSSFVGAEAIRQTIFGLQPKVNSHNEIIIHPIKDSWTKEEIIKLIHKLDDDLRIHLDPNELDIWIKENLS